MIHPETLARVVNEQLQDLDHRPKFQKMVDGNGAFRVAKKIVDIV